MHATHGIGIRTAGIHHIAIRSTDLARAKVFYIDRLGFPLLVEEPGLIIFAVGSATVRVRAADDPPRHDVRFDPRRVGLDHIALACADAAELRRVAGAMTAAGIHNGGIAFDRTLGGNYVGFTDPDGVVWELYVA